MAAGPDLCRLARPGCVPLTEAEDRAAYARVMSDALRPGGAAIVATFADDGPEMCSGLQVVRYALDDLAREFEHLNPDALKKIESRQHKHVTPKGNRQSSQYSVFRKATLNE
jgi:hypothetical protein